MEKLEISKYKIPLESDFINSSHSYKYIDAIIVRNNKGMDINYYEISPLVGFSIETIEMIYDYLSNRRNKNIFDYPSISYGLESLKLSKRKLISAKTAISIPVTPNLSEKISEYYLKGFRNFKIKISKRNLKIASEIINDLSKKNKKILFRLDCNGDFNFNESVVLLKRFESKKIEFIEDLHKTISEKNLSIIKKYDYKTCIDLNKSNINITKQLIRKKLVDYIAIKPKLIGKEDEIIEFIELAKKYKTKVYISSAFETPIGLYKNILLSKKVDKIYKTPIVHGLSTSLYLNKSITKAMELDSGKIKLRYGFFSINDLKPFMTKEWIEIQNTKII